ncbi:MAG: GntR family transcriptional regulator [Eubacteriaceae bacterium]
MKTYEMISKDIQEKIESGFFREAEQLPSLRELSKIYQSTTVTVKKSLSILEEKGYIKTIDRKGSFVKNQASHAFTLIFHELKSIDQLTETKVDKMEKVNIMEFYQEFGIIEEKALSKCVKIRSLLFHKNMPIGLDVKYLLLGSGVNTSVHNLERLGESLSLVLNNYDIDKELEIKVPEDNKVVRTELYLDPEDPIFAFKQIYKTMDGRLVGAGITYVPCNEIRIKLEN